MIRSIEVIRLTLPIAKPLTLARGIASDPKAGAPHILVRVENDKSVVGWGEARPSPRWSYETGDTAVSTIRNYLAPALLNHEEDDVAGLHARMDVTIAPGVQIGQPIAKSAIDLAVHDLLGKKHGQSLSALLGRRSSAEVRLCYVVSAPTIDEAVRQTNEGMEKGYHGFKVKAGIHPSTDLEMMQEIAKVARGKTLWVDANQGWDPTTAIRLSKLLASLGVAVLEQPLAANDITGYHDLVQRSEIPVVLDESVYTPRDLIQFIRLGAIGGLVLKLCRAGGVFWTRQLAEMAQSAGLLLLGSGLTEGRISLHASAHLFSAFGITMPVDLNGPQFLSDDMVAGQLSFPGQVVIPPDTPGIGVEPDPAKVERYRVAE